MTFSGNTPARADRFEVRSGDAFAVSRYALSDSYKRLVGVLYDNPEVSEAASGMKIFIPTGFLKSVIWSADEIWQTAMQHPGVANVDSLVGAMNRKKAQRRGTLGDYYSGVRIGDLEITEMPDGSEKISAPIIGLKEVLDGNRDHLGQIATYLAQASIEEGQAIQLAPVSGYDLDIARIDTNGLRIGRLLEALNSDRPASVDLDQVNLSPAI